MPNWLTLGTHRYYREADLLFVDTHGVVTLPDIKVIMEALEEIERDYGYTLTLYVADTTVSMAADARRYVGEKGRTRSPEAAAAIVGASLTVRIVVDMLRNAARLFGKKNPPLKFCSTVEDAWQWLATERVRLTELMAKSGRPPRPPASL